jgi:hypothetical protein
MGGMLRKNEEQRRRGRRTCTDWTPVKEENGEGWVEKASDFRKM